MAQAADCIREYEAGKGSLVIYFSYQLFSQFFSVGASSRTDYTNASISSSSDPRQSREYDNQPRYNSFSLNRGSSNAVRPKDSQLRNNYGNNSV